MAFSYFTAYKQVNMSLWSFYKTLLRHPKTVGAATPSSKWLAQTIASFLDGNATQTVLELGAGTGVITQALVNKVVDSKRLIVVENSSIMANKLKNRFPDLRIIHGDAMHLEQLLSEHPTAVGTVISSLPLLSLPKRDRQRILDSICAVMSPGSTLVQFTYGLFKPSLLEKIPALSKRTSKVVYRNIPPARVDVFDYHP